MKFLCILTLLIVAAWAFPITTATAQGSESYDGFRGAGAIPCKELTAALEEGIEFEAIGNWIYGYWSGLNIMAGAAGNPEYDLFTKNADMKPLEALVLAHCYQNPNDIVSGAARKLFFSFPQLESP